MEAATLEERPGQGHVCQGDKHPHQHKGQEHTESFHPGKDCLDALLCQSILEVGFIESIDVNWCPLFDATIRFDDRRLQKINPVSRVSRLNAQF